jgi:hypothetical protein
MGGEGRQGRSPLSQTLSAPPPPTSIPPSGGLGRAVDTLSASPGATALAIVLVAGGLALVVLAVVAVLARRGVRIGPIDLAALLARRDEPAQPGPRARGSDDADRAIESLRDELADLRAQLAAIQADIDDRLGRLERPPTPERRAPAPTITPASAPTAVPAVTVRSRPVLVQVPVSPPPTPRPAPPAAPIPAPVAAPRPQPSTLDATTAEVYRLADEGSSAVDIAQRLRQHVGAVELILALRTR